MREGVGDFDDLRIVSVKYMKSVFFVLIKKFN